MEIPQGATLKDISAHYNQLTIPRELMAPSTLPPEHWGKVVVDEGEVKLYLEGVGASETLTSQRAGIVPPQTAFHLGLERKAGRFHLEYYHEPRISDAQQLAGQMGRK